MSKKFVIYAKKEFNTDDNGKVRDHCHIIGKYRGAAYNVFNLSDKALKEMLAVFYNGSTYDYHFIIKELAEEFSGQFECLEENTEKYIIFSVPIKNDKKVHKK